jgi:sulfatase maturation enzyme AslB (radical SAM superfamily)
MNEKTDRYSQDRLLTDGSVNFAGEDRAHLLTLVGLEPRIGALLHPEVRYEVTDHCNAECIMCPRDKHEHGREHGIMDLDCYKKSIDEVVALGAKKIVLTGFGEPLVDKMLEQKVAYAKSYGLNTYIISNGSLLTEKRASGLIDAGLDEMRVSFYGMRPETYNVVMRKLDFSVTMANLLRFLDLREAKGAKKPRLEVNYLVLPENETDTDAFRTFWEPRADAIEIWKPHNFGDGRDYRTRLEDLAVKNTCGRPENGPLQIQWNGEVIPCCYDYNNQIILGNAFETPVLDLLNGTKYRLLRIAHRDKKFGCFPYCDQCDQLLPHADALVYTNRHSLPPEVAVKMSNTDLYNLVEAQEFRPENLNPRYADGLLQIKVPGGPGRVGA